MVSSKDEQPKKMEMNDLTHEQLSDVYAAGTSDGINQLKNKELKIVNKPYSS